MHAHSGIGFAVKQHEADQKLPACMVKWETERYREYAVFCVKRELGEGREGVDKTMYLHKEIPEEFKNI